MEAETALKRPLNNKVKPEAVARPTVNRLIHYVLIELCREVPEFKAYQPQRLVVSISASKSLSESRYGTWAYITPLRYPGGSFERRGKRRGRNGVFSYQQTHLETLKQKGFDPLYVITFLVPKFFHLTPRERLETLVHELYHCHPEFRGDLRRFPAPHIHHGPTPKAFDRKVQQMTSDFVAKNPAIFENPIFATEASTMISLKRKHFPRPKLCFTPDTLMARAATATTLLQRLGFASLLVIALFASLRTFAQTPIPEVPTETAARPIVRAIEGRELKSAPSELSEDLLVVGPQEKFLAMQKDSSGEWVFLRNRFKQGWIPLKMIEIVGNLAVPRPPVPPAPTPAEQSDRPYSTRLEGQSGSSEALIEESVGDDYVGEFNNFYVTRSGEFFEEPDSGSTRYGFLERNDEVRVVRRDKTGDWALIQLQLTGEEGWYPARYIKMNKPEDPDRYRKGTLVIEGDAGYGGQGRNLGGNAGILFDLNRGSSRSRFEFGVNYGYWLGEQLSFQGSSDTFTLNVRYQVGEVLGRFVQFSPSGLIAGAFEVGAVYQRPTANITGIDPIILGQVGLTESLKSRVGLGLGTRALLSLGFLGAQLNVGVRYILASRTNTVYATTGLSFRWF